MTKQMVSSVGATYFFLEIFRPDGAHFLWLFSSTNTRPDGAGKFVLMRWKSVRLRRPLHKLQVEYCSRDDVEEAIDRFLSEEPPFSGGW